MIGKVLIISYYFPPMALSGVQRTLKFVKYLPEYEWEPVVLTTTDSAVYYAFDNNLIDEISNDSISIYRTSTDPTQKIKKLTKGNKIAYPSRSTEKIRKMLLQTFFQPDSRRPWKKYALETGRKIIQENDIKVIYATAPPFTDFLIAEQLSKEFGIPFIIDYRDLWVDNAYYFYATPLHKRYAVKLEAMVLNQARKSIVTSRYMKEKLLKRYDFLTHNDIAIIPHGYDSADFENVTTINKSDKFILTHSGLFPDDLTPKYFLQAVSRLLKEKPQLKNKIELRFFGLMRKKHIDIISKLKLNDITKLYGYISHNEVVKGLLESDVLWMMLPNNIATPSRIYEYIGSRKPMIISAIQGNMTQTAEQSGAAIITSPTNIDEIKNAIKTMYNKYNTNNLPKISQEYVEKFDRKHLTSDLSVILSYAMDID